jgi:hypothetical protein
VYKIHVVSLQLPSSVGFGAVRHALFAYNEAPAIAVAKDCWFGARQYSTRPFFLSPRFNSIT